MIENLRMLLNDIKHLNEENKNKINNYTDYVFALECAIEILEIIRNKGRSIQNGDIE